MEGGSKMEPSYLIKPLLDKDYPVISHGEGIYLYDIAGNKYLDGCSGAVTASIGHNIQSVIEAMMDQASKVSFVYRSQFTSEPSEKLATKLMEISPGDVNWSFFVNSGTEAIETAMKIAIQHWQEIGLPQKTKVISRWNSYHGITIGALSLSGFTTRRERFESLLEKSPIVEPPYCYRCPFDDTYPNCQLKCATDLERAILDVGPDSIAAFIAEPIVGAAAGAITPPDGYYEKIKEICNNYNILFIADEVMSGIGRTGEMFAINHWNVVPDIICIGKGMSAGYTPIAATLVSNKVLDPILRGSKIIMSGHTYSANPQSTAVSLAVLQYIEQNNLVEHAANIGDYLFEKLQKLNKAYKIIGDVRGKGLFIGIELVADKVKKYPFSFEKAVTKRLVEIAQWNGLLIYPANAGIDNNGGDAFIIAPPLTITEKEVDDLVILLDKSLKQLESEMLSGV